jgi:hypothetical protein
VGVRAEIIKSLPEIIKLTSKRVRKHNAIPPSLIFSTIEISLSLSALAQTATAPKIMRVIPGPTGKLRKKAPTVEHPGEYDPTPEEEKKRREEKERYGSDERSAPMLMQM